MLLTDIFPPANPLDEKVLSSKVKSLKAKANMSRSTFAIIVDKINNFFGSSFFLFLNVLFFVSWILVNGGYVSAIKPFDPYPYNFLTMTVSLEAIFLSIFVLLSQNRAAKISDVREEVTLEMLVTTEAEVTKTLKLLDHIQDKLGIPNHDDFELKHMEKNINTQKVVDQIEREIDEN